MAIVKGPCFSISSSGSIGKTLTFLTWKGKATAKGSYLKDWNGYYFTRRIPESQTIEQRAVRATFENGKTAWNNLSEGEKDEYNKKAVGKSYTGYNLFIKEYIIENLSVIGYSLAFLYAFTGVSFLPAVVSAYEKLAIVGKMKKGANS